MSNTKTYTHEELLVADPKGLTLEQKALRQYLMNQRYSKVATAKTAIMLKKAKEAGIVVTDEEVEEYLAK